MGGSGFNLRVHFFFQLREQPIFQPLVVLEGSDLSGLGGIEFFGQRLGVPRLQRQAAAALEEQRGAPQNTEEAAPQTEPGIDQASALAFSRAYSSAEMVPASCSALASLICSAGDLPAIWRIYLSVSDLARSIACR